MYRFFAMKIIMKDISNILLHFPGPYLEDKTNENESLYAKVIFFFKLLPNNLVELKTAAGC